MAEIEYYKKLGDLTNNLSIVRNSKVHQVNDELTCYMSYKVFKNHFHKGEWYTVLDYNAATDGDQSFDILPLEVCTINDVMRLYEDTIEIDNQRFPRHWVDTLEVSTVATPIWDMDQKITNIKKDSSLFIIYVYFDNDENKYSITTLSEETFLLYGGQFIYKCKDDKIKKLLFKVVKYQINKVVNKN